MKKQKYIIVRITSEELETLNSFFETPEIAGTKDWLKVKDLINEHYNKSK